MASKRLKINGRDKTCCFGFVMSNRIAFRNKYMPIATGRFYRTRFYQYPMALSESMVMLGGRSLGKCMPLCYIYLCDGSKKLNRDLVGKKFEVASLGNNYKVRGNNATCYEVGVKECYKIQTNFGREIPVSKEHKFFTPNGWKKLEDLEIKDYVAIPRNNPFFGDYRLDKRKIKTLAYLIGDGHLFRKFNMSLKDKFIPDKIKFADRQTLIWFMEALFNTDSWYCELKGGFQLGYSSKSKKLINDIIDVLLKFNILMSVCKKTVNGEFYYTCSTNDILEIRKFLEIFNVFKYSKENISFVFDKEMIPGTCASKSDLIPRDFIKDKVVSNRKYRLRPNVDWTRERALRYAEEYNNQDVRDIATSDIYWDKVKSIEPIGKQMCYDLSVERDHNYIAENIFAHNSYDLEGTILQWAITKPNEESLLTAFRRTHIKDREENTITYLQRVPYFKAFLLGKNRTARESVSRTPIYEIRLRNGHVHVGISVGDDPAAVMIQGHHPCLHPEQTVVTTKGRISIRRIIAKVRKGEDIFVKSYSKEEKKIVERRVVDGWFTPIGDKKLFRVCTKDDSCVLTCNHPIYKISNSDVIFTETKDIKIGDKVVSDNINLETEILKIEEVEIDTDVVCDISVEDTHNFLIGQMIVSNCYRLGEEFQFYTQSAWVKWQNTQDPKGSIDRYYGVVDGRSDTPFRKLDTVVEKFKNVRFHISRLNEPHFNQEIKGNLIESLGGEDTNEYKQQCLSLWGSPTWGVWDEEAIADSFDKTEHPEYKGLLVNNIKVIEITPKEYTGALPSDVLKELPPLPKNDCDVVMGIDAGYISPTMILPFFRYEGKWNLRCRIVLKEKIIADDTAELIDYIADFYKAGIICMDCTSSEGKAPATSLCNPKREQYNTKNYEERIIWCEFQKKMVMGYTQDGSEIIDTIKGGTTTILRQMFAKQSFRIYKDEELLEDFNREYKQKTKNGEHIATPNNVHIPEAFRCFAYGHFMTYGGAEKPKRDYDGNIEYPIFEDFLPLFGRG